MIWMALFIASCYVIGFVLSAILFIVLAFLDAAAGG